MHAWQVKRNFIAVKGIEIIISFVNGKFTPLEN